MIGYTKFDALNDYAMLEAAAREDLNARSLRVSAVLNPVKLIVTNYPEGQTEEMEAVNNPENEADGTHTITFSRELWIEREDFMEDAPKKFFRITIGGRTGKHTPRLGKTFINFATEEVVLGVLGNWQKFSAWVLDYKPVYMHGGHLIDMAGYEKFKEMILDGVELNPEAKVAQRIMWAESEMRGQINVIPIGEHPVAGPQQ